MVLWIILQLLFVAVAVASNGSSVQMCRDHERQALLAFKMGFSISNDPFWEYYCGDYAYAKTNSWSSSSDCCEWDGVTCDSLSGHVVELDLSCSLLTGSFPSNSTLFLPSSLPTNVNTTMLAGLYVIDLSCNMITGIIPGWIFTLPSLNYLRLDHNLFTGIGEFDIGNGSIISTSLTTLVANDNRLQGQIPEDIFDFHNLEELELEGNNLTGTIPLSKLLKLQSLETLLLSDNNLSIIDDMGADSALSLPSLVELGLSSCNLGHFPGFLRDQVNLTRLELSNNGIHGVVPHWLSDMSNLSSLNLSHNSLSGGLEHLPWQNMIRIDIRYNLMMLMFYKHFFKSRLWGGRA